MYYKPTRRTATILMCHVKEILCAAFESRLDVSPQMSRQLSLRPVTGPLFADVQHKTRVRLQCLRLKRLFTVLHLPVKCY